MCSCINNNSTPGHCMVSALHIWVCDRLLDGAALLSISFGAKILTHPESGMLSGLLK